MKNPKYVTKADAVNKLKNNGCYVEEDGSFIKVTGSPGLKLLGAIDFLRKTHTVTIVPREQTKKEG